MEIAAWARLDFAIVTSFALVLHKHSMISMMDAMMSSILLNVVDYGDYSFS